VFSESKVKRKVALVNARKVKEEGREVRGNGRAEVDVEES
jgi:hypothetical protein